MIHARHDYNRFQDPLGKIPADEPVMLFRAQDKHFTKLLSYYLLLLGKDENADVEMIRVCAEHIRLAQQWQAERGCKTPDLERAA